MFGSKLPGSGEIIYGDQEKDANSVLMELDKGLRSTKPGEQCEAIVRFPRLFEKYPFPILINSAFLKLADLFRIGSNFLRQCILKVTQQSEKHLDKIVNTDEFLRRIYSVSHSNDPVARAITLRTLGQAAHIIAERKNIHHSIINGLDSHDAVEQEAAIFAASCFAAQSKDFTVSICTKLEDMIQGLSTPIGMKLKLIPIFQHMHHEASTTKKVTKLCTDTLLPLYPSRAFVQVTLHTMSLLAAKSLCDLPQQVDLLLQYLERDCRRSVKILALKDLYLLSQQSPHMWSERHIQVLCQTGLASPYTGLKLGILKVLTSLSDTVAVDKFSIDPEEVVMEFCLQSCYESHLLLASYGAQLHTHLTIHAAKGDGSSNMAEECSTILDMLITLTSDPGKHVTTAQQMCMRSVTLLCKACPHQTDHFVDALMSAVATSEGSERLTLCHSLAALGSIHGDLMSALTSDLLLTLKTVTSGELSKKDKDIVVALVILLFQACIDEDKLSDDVDQAINNALSKVDSWAAYKISRQATRYGHHEIAASIFKTLVNQVSSEHYTFWLSALKECCQGDSCLRGNLEKLSVTQYVRQVAQAEVHYHNAVATLKAASIPSHPLDFQISYLEHHAEMLQVLTQVVQICCSFQTSPPPAIATSLAMTTSQDFHRCRHVINQLRKCQKSAESLREAYNDLHNSSFDADVESLTNLQILQEVCHLLIHTLETVFVLSKRESSSSSLEGLPVWKSMNRHLPLEYYHWNQIRGQILDIIERTIPTASQATLTHHHIECLRKVSMLISHSPLCLPRYFYQRLQATDIKLALSPQPRSQNEPISVHFDTHMTLKVEGVIQHGRESGLHRHIRSVHMSIVSSQQSKGPTQTEEKVQEVPTNDMTQIAVPHNDYFTSHFLLAFPVPGLYLVKLNTSVQDDEGAIWSMGMPVTLMVKSFDEAVQRQQQQQYAAQRQQQRAALVASISGAS